MKNYYGGAYEGHVEAKNVKNRDKSINAKRCRRSRIFLKGGLGFLSLNSAAITGFLVFMGALSGCHHSYDPKENPLLTEPVSVTAPALISLEKIVRQKYLGDRLLLNDDSETSLIEVCSLDKTNLSTSEVRSTKSCDFIFEKIVEEARNQGGELKSLTVDDLNDAEAESRLHNALFSLAAYGHLPREYS